jgi:CheY-like chemotaxis protein
LLLRESPDQTLAGRHVLVVEDQWLLAADLEHLLRSRGCAVVGPFARAAEALAVLQGPPWPDAAILDVHLLDGTSVPVAARLRSLGVPFLILSAYPRTALDAAELREAPHLGKPASEQSLLGSVAALLGG